MATGAIIVLVIVIVVIALAATLAGTLMLRRRALRHRFGDEYDQLAERVGQRRAQAELLERRRRVAKLDIRPLSAERSAGYAREWMSVQEAFIDGPAQSVEAAAGLVSAVAADCGYPADDENRLVGDLSVYHANRIDGYRRARDATRRASTAGTEELRQAVLGYRALFRDLISPDPTAASPGEGAAGGEGMAAEDGGRQPAAAAARASKAREDASSDDATADGVTGDEGDEAEGAVAGVTGDGRTAGDEGAAAEATGDGRTAGDEATADGGIDSGTTGDEATDGEATSDDGGTWVDSGRREYRAAAPAARED